MALRAVSTLKTPEEFQLSRDQRTSGFLHFYGSKHKDSIARIILSLIFQPFIPQTRREDFTQKEKRKTEARFKMCGIVAGANRSVLKKVMGRKEEGFIFEVPIYLGMELTPENQQIWVEELLGEKLGINFTGHTYTNTFIDFKTLEKFLKLSGSTMNNLSKTLRGIEIKNEPGKTTIVAKWFISRQEAEFMTTTKFLSIRPGNLYIMLHMWAISLFGDKQTMPIASMPISYIASHVKNTVAKGSQIVKRNAVEGIVVLEDGSLIWLPDVDNSMTYEQALNDYGIQDDGSYTFNIAREGGGGPKELRVDRGDDDDDGEGDAEDDLHENDKRKLPKNMPVFMDWVNLKFAYSQYNGILGVLDLERAVPVRPYHVRTLLEYTILFSRSTYSGIAKSLFQAINTAAKIDASVALKPTKAELEWGKITEPSDKVEEYVEDALERLVQNQLLDDVSIVQDAQLSLLSEDSPALSLRCVGRALKAAQKVCEAHLENVFRQYSVMTTIGFMADIKLFNKYASKKKEIDAADNKERDVYINQGLDPKYKPESLPNIKKDFEFLPHQARGFNLLRKNPKLVIIDVDAGGGKTLQILTYVLKMIKDGKCKKPIILCPGHLVSQYIKEAVFLTEGKLNVIPIGRMVGKYHGYPRLQKMIDTAPPNTVVVSDYDFLSRSNKTNISYGIKPVTIYNNVEFLRQFMFDMVCTDESHYLKNDSTRSEAAHRFLAEIPIKVLASGTIVMDTPTDIVAQFALLDPTVFGDRGRFVAQYAEETRGDKVMSWRPNALQSIRRKMKEHCVFISARRKEWATLLPDPSEKFHIVEMTELQMKVYQSVLQKTLELIQEAMEKDPELKKAMQEAEDEGKFEQLAALLKPYLSRLEQYLAAPSRDELGKEILTDKEDKTSPKTKKIIEIIRHHLGLQLNNGWDEEDEINRRKGEPLYGKILIFTNHLNVAEDIYESLPPDLKAMTIHYKAGQKIEARAEFEKNPKKMIMVGVEKSMNTGLNFQFASRLIRVETVWTPGEMEQGNARINRPQLKQKEKRKFVFLDWLVVDKSFDITKVSRLIAKMIQKAKFDEADNPAFQDLPDVDLVPMTLENIASSNDFTTLKEYNEAYQQYKYVLYDDYRKYREANKDKMDPVPVPSSGLIKGSKLMSRVPYVPDMELYGEDELGLIRYDEFMRKDIDYEQQDEADSEEEGEELSQRDKNKIEAEKVVGMGAHTEFGDGIILGVGKRRIQVQLESGEVVRTRKLASYIITRSMTNAKDIRTQLMKMAGNLPLAAPVDVPALMLMKKGKKLDKMKKGKEEVVQEIPEEQVQTQGLEIEIIPIIANDFLGLAFRDMENTEAVAALTQFGFRQIPPYMRTEIKTPQVMYNLFKAWLDKGFSIKQFVRSRVKLIYDQMKGKQTFKTAGFANKIRLKNFFLREYKPSNDAEQIKPYPLLEDSRVYIVLPLRGQVGTQRAIKVNVPGIKWVRTGEDQVVRFVLTKPEAAEVLKKMEGAGIKFTNKKQLIKTLQQLKIVKRKADEGEDD
jgi:hypothetical protein